MKPFQDKSPKSTFNSQVAGYDTYRPGYPDALIERLIDVANLSNDSNLLEIGPGTGQATLLFAKKGYSITAIELGSELAEAARNNLRQYPKVSILHGSYEEASIGESSLDLVYAATAFHWVEDEYKFTKTSSILKPKGHIAIIHVEYIDGDDGSEFISRSSSIYSKYLPKDEVIHRSIFTLPAAKDLKQTQIDTKMFKFVEFDVFTETITYTGEEYSGLLSTYSPVINLPSAQRKMFLAEIEELIKNEFNNALRRKLAFTLTVAQNKKTT